jgi:outer membrane lipoprotein-sorting protein
MADWLQKRFGVLAAGILVLVASGPACRKEKPNSSQGTASGTNNTSKPRVDSSRLSRKETDKAIEELIEAWDKVTAASVTVTAKAKRDLADRAESKGKGVYNYKEEDGRTRIHYYLNSQIDFWFGENKYFTLERVEWVSYGDTLDHLVLQYENRKRTRSKYDHEKVLQLGGRPLFDSLTATHEIDLLGREQEPGKEIYVFETRSKDGSGRGTHFFDRSNGIRVKWVEEDDHGEVLLEMTVPDVNLSPTFDEKSFEMTYYENVDFVDEITGEVIPAARKQEAPAAAESATPPPPDAEQSP